MRPSTVSPGHTFVPRLQLLLKSSGLLLGAVGIGLAVWFFIPQRDRPSLALEVTAETPLVSPGVADFENLSISLRSADQELSTPIDELWLTSFRLINDGNTTLRAADFESPIRLKLQEGQVMDVSVGESEPKYLTPNLAVEEIDGKARGVEIQGLLLNPGDSISFSILSSEQVSDTLIEARVARIKEISRIAASQEPTGTRAIRTLVWIGLVSVAAGVLGVSFSLLASWRVAIRPRLEDEARTMPQP